MAASAGVPGACAMTNPLNCRRNSYALPEEGGVGRSQFVEHLPALGQDVELDLFDAVGFARVFETEERFALDVVFVTERLVVERVGRIGERVAQPVDVKGLAYGRIAAHVFHVHQQLDRVERRLAVLEEVGGEGLCRQAGDDGSRGGPPEKVVFGGADVAHVEIHRAAHVPGGGTQSDGVGIGLEGTYPLAFASSEGIDAYGELVLAAGNEVAAQGVVHLRASCRQHDRQECDRGQ